MADIVSMPKLGFDMAEGTLVRWVIQEGHPVTKGAVLAEIETDKATVEVESNFDGIVIRHMVPQGEIVPVGSPIAVIGEENEQVTLTDQAMVGDKAVDEQKITAPVSVTEDIRATGSQTSDEQLDVQLPGGVRASPVARRMAEEQGVDLKKVMGSGPTGRITRKDIEGYISSRRVSAPTPDIVQVTSPAAIKEVIVERNVTDETIPLSRLRAAIGRRMVESVQNIPHFYVTHNYDMAAIVNLRKQINMLLPDNEKLSVNDFILKAVALTLRDFPNLNASLGEGNNAIVRHGKINVGSAVAVETGLLTVVCHDTDLKSLRQI